MMYRDGINRQSAPDEPGEIFREDADLCGFMVGDRELPMNQKGRGKFEIYKDSDNSVVIFQYSLNQEVFLFSQVMFGVIGQDLIALGYKYQL